jgi:hypothetical protein
MIIQVVILLIIIIIWLQYPQTIKNDKNLPLYKKIFNIIKIPVVIICFIIIIYSYLNINFTKEQIKDFNVYMSIPKF